MTAQEILQHLKKQPFLPFRIGMDNGETIDVKHPELALISATGALYVYQPAKDAEHSVTPEAQVAGIAVVCELRNISTIRPVPRQTA